MTAALRRFASLPPVLQASLGILFLTAMDAVVKAQMQSHPVAVAVCLRFMFGGLVALAVVGVMRPPVPTRSELLANVLRVPVVVLTAGSFFYSVSLLPLAEAIGLSFLAPGFIALLGVLLLKERLDAAVLVALAAGFVGMAVMLWPKLQMGVTGSTLGVAAALFAAFAYAFNIILLRKLAQNQHVATIVFFQNAGPAVMLAPLAWWFWTPQGLNDCAMYLLAALLGVFGHMMLTQAFSRAPASRIAPTEYTSLVWAALLGFLFFAEVPTLYTFAGSALIVAGSIWLGKKH
jgi:drug/metabolite transporter (DMT)-like permease